MATNPPKGDGHRNGAVRDRTQVYNPENDKWVKRDSETGRFMDVKRVTASHLKELQKKTIKESKRSFFAS